MNLDDLGRRAGAELQSDAVTGADGLPSADALIRQSGQRRAARVAASSFLVVAALVGAVALAGAGGGGDETQQVAAEGDGADDRSGPAPCDSNLEAGATMIVSADADGTVVSIVGDAEGEGRPCATSPTVTTDPPPSTTVRDLPPCDVGAPTTFTFADGACIPTDPSTTTSIVVPPPTPSTSTSIAPIATTSTTTVDAPPPSPAIEARVEGRVTAGPVCPVETMPPDPACADKGIVAVITFTRVDGNAELLYERTVTTGADGRYSIYLPLGRYSVSTTSAAAMSCTSTTVQHAAASTTLNLSCDTGIR